jgi:hypothetical protein
VAPTDDVTYDERLTVPLWWWPVGVGVTMLLGAEAHAGFGWLAAVLVDGPLLVLVGSALYAVGRTRIRVDGAALRPGRVALALSRVDGVRILDVDARRHRMGTGADVRAVLVTRPWITTAVEVELTTDDGPDGDPAPYWLVSTRHPQELAAAVLHSAGTPSQHGSS